MHKKLTQLLLTSAALGSLCLSFSLSAHAQVDAVYDQGSSALIRMLERLQTTASVLHIGAHPDDEDSALVAYHARRMNARTAYLSLTRGSGGQNIIGAEQSDALGVIRTEELLQARRLDGASQYFTRANDFGFSKTRTEASRMWPENELLADMVRTIREFRPDVVVSRWNGTSSDGHGHHQFAGYLTPLAVAAAANGGRFTDQIDAGLQPWQVQKLYVSLRSDPADPNAQTLEINTGEYDPVTGRSFFQIGMQGRSQQKTQQMGSLELQGAQLSVLQLTESNIAINSDERSVFDGIDTSISGLIRFERQPASAFIELSGELQAMIAGILNNFNPLEPAAAVAELAEAHELANLAKDAAHDAETIRLLEEKILEIESALVLAAGVRVDALTDTEMLVPGTTANIAVRAYMPGASASLNSAQVNAPAGWRVSAADMELLPDETGRRRIERPKEQAFFQVAIPAEANVTQPYWLEKTREGAAYDWSTAGAAQTLPFAVPLITAEVVFDIAGVTTAVYKEVEYRQLDRIRGEVRRRIDIVPAVSVEPATDLLVVPESASAQPIQLLLTVHNNSQDSIEGSAQFALPPGWNLEPAFIEFALPPAPASSTLAFEVSMPADVQAGEYRLIGSALVGGKRYQQAVQEIAYPHIRTHRIYSESKTEVEVVDVEVADVQVGYVMGSGDLVPAALRRLGLEVSILSDDELTTGDLSRFDTIVVGIRASQTRQAFVSNNERLLEFADEGGTLIVQYQQPDFAVQNLAPFPVAMERNVRVVDETAPITILEPDHPVFSFPNQIDAQDFEGWVQERNNYNFSSFDRERYVPLTEAHDEGESPSDGAMLHARIGSGNYVYTSYSWFRQLPAGVPGAYRIFANLLSLPAAPQ